MTFCTAINCMDGRVQVPVIIYLQQRFGADFVDTITEPGPNLILSEQTKQANVQSILERLRISVELHHSKGVAIVGHHDCAGNPSPQEDQVAHIRNAIDFIKKQYSQIEVIGLWVDQDKLVHEISQVET